MEPRILIASLDFRTNLPVCLGFMNGPLILGNPKPYIEPLYLPVKGTSNFGKPTYSHIRVGLGIYGLGPTNVTK